MRALFSDGINSAAHLAVGAAAVRVSIWVAAAFVVYEFTAHDDVADTLPAFLEFGSGALAAYFYGL